MAEVAPLTLFSADPALAGSTAGLAGSTAYLAGATYGPTGESLSIPVWRPREERATYARRLSRSPYGSARWAVGDGDREGGQVVVDAFYIGDGADAGPGAPTVDALLALAETATALVWGEYTRSVRGLAWHARTPTVVGTRVTLAFHVSGGTWVDGLGAEVVL